MPGGRRCETLLSICSRSKVCPTTRSTDRLLWHMLGPSIGPRGRWESESFLAYYFPHHSVREAHLRRLSASLCGQNKRVTQGGKQQSPDWYFRLTHSLTYCQIPHLVPFWCSLLADFDWLVLFRLAFCCSSDPTDFLLFTSRQRGPYLILYPEEFDCNPVAFWRKNTRSWQKTKHHPPTGSRVTNSPGQNLSFYL